MIRLTLPWPTSTNRTWRRSGKHIHLNPKANTYRLAVKSIVAALKLPNLPIQGPIEIKIVLHTPDRRRRDQDNFAGKSLLDALTNAGVWTDDSQICRTVIEWGEIVKGGMVKITISKASKPTPKGFTQ